MPQPEVARCTPAETTCGLPASRLRPTRWRTLTALVLFGVSFGYVEAAIVVYLRAIYEPMREAVIPDSIPHELFPLLRFDQLEAQGDEHVHRLLTELGREAATLLMIAAAALAVARNFHQWFAAFVFVFGVWDIFYYVFLKVLIDWPESMLTWDILFLLPVPWTGPVWAPVLVAVSMVVAGGMVLWRDDLDRPIRLRPADWTMVVLGGVLIVTAFCWDYRNVATGGWPNPFNWPLYAVGEATGLIGFIRALRRSGTGDTPSAVHQACA